MVLVHDDLFRSELGPGAFDLVHARFELAPLGRADAEVLVLPPGHPYLRLPLQFSVSLEPRLLHLVSGSELVQLRQLAETEIADPSRWGTTFTLIRTWGQVPRSSRAG